MPLGEGWRDQYDRMLRSYANLAAIARGAFGSSTESRDAMYHFFQDVYHLKDWLINDPVSNPATKGRPGHHNLESHINATPALDMCGEICNGIKHLVLQTHKAPGQAAELVGQNVNVMVGTGMAAHTWDFAVDGQRHRVMDLADDAVEAWQTWLTSKGLI